MTKDINDNINGTSAKYEILSTFVVKGVVEVQDIVGALFGQTEGLLEDLELRELQKSGRVGRIVVEADSENGITRGKVIIPSSLDKTETAILAATLETVERVGPCAASFELQEIKDLRRSKLEQIEKRAKELLKGWKGLKEDKDLSEKINEEMEKDQIIKWHGLDAGQDIDKADEIIIVEGRNDIQELLKIGVKNTIAVNGTSIPKTIIELTKKKNCTAFLDGDRGGKMIMNELIQVSNIKYYVFAPNKKEVEELTRKELVEALQNKKPVSDYKKKNNKDQKSKPIHKSSHQSNDRNNKGKQNRPDRNQKRGNRNDDSRSGRNKRSRKPNVSIPKQFTEQIKNLISSNQAIGLDKQGNEVLKTSNVELIDKINGNVNTVIIDGVINQKFLDIAEDKNIKTLIAVNFAKNLNFKEPDKIDLFYFKDFL